MVVIGDFPLRKEDIFNTLDDVFMWSNQPKKDHINIMINLVNQIFYPSYSQHPMAKESINLASLISLNKVDDEARNSLLNRVILKKIYNDINQGCPI